MYIEPLGLDYLFIWKKGTYTDSNGTKYVSHYGHASIMSNSGKYLSHHPQKTTVTSFLKSKFRTYDEDRDLYGREADIVVWLKNSDTVKTNEYIDHYLANDNIWDPFNNCVDATLGGMNEGGVNIDDINKGLYNNISHPHELEQQLLLMDPTSFQYLRYVNPF